MPFLLCWTRLVGLDEFGVLPSFYFIFAWKNFIFSLIWLNLTFNDFLHDSATFNFQHLIHMFQIVPEWTAGTSTFLPLCCLFGHQDGPVYLWLPPVFFILLHWVVQFPHFVLWHELFEHVCAVFLQFSHQSGLDRITSFRTLRFPIVFLHKKFFVFTVKLEKFPLSLIWEFFHVDGTFSATLWEGNSSRHWSPGLRFDFHRLRWVILCWVHHRIGGELPIVLPWSWIKFRHLSHLLLRWITIIHRDSLHIWGLICWNMVWRGSRWPWWLIIWPNGSREDRMINLTYLTAWSLHPLLYVWLAHWNRWQRRNLFKLAYSDIF